MNLEEVYAAFDAARWEIFRLEAKQSYAGVPDPGWDAWRAGHGLMPVAPEDQEWYDKISARAAAGVRQHRVLVVDEPLDPYLHYEMASFHRGNVAAGEQILVVRRAEHLDLGTFMEDFWMFDEKIVAVMNYDADHCPLGPSARTRPISAYVTQRDLALSRAVPLDRWMTEHPELLTG